MNVGFTLVGALLFLAPGFAFVVANSLEQPPFLRRPFLSSGSLAILGVVPAFSSLAHAVAIFGISLIQSVLRLIPKYPPGLELSPYPAMLNTLQGVSVDPHSLAWAMFWLALVPLLGIWTAMARSRFIRWRKSKRFGQDTRWPNETVLEFLYRLSSAHEDRALVATVYTKSPLVSAHGGWVGIVDEVRVDQIGAIVSVTLIEPTSFQVSDFDPGGWNPKKQKPLDAYREHDWGSKYASITIPGEQIQSVSYFVTLPPIEATGEIRPDPATLEAAGTLVEQ